MSKQLLSALSELVEAGLITSETADAIEAYYDEKRKAGPNRMLLAFAILGALLMGLGIILIVAHNWDNYSRMTKTAFAFMPLVLGQVAAGFTILRRPDSMVWREASSVFLILAIGACISLVSQIFHLLGDLSDFLFWWTVLSLPLMYILRSSMASLLVWVGAAYYAIQAGYFEEDKSASPWYWMMVLAALPYYYQLSRRYETSNFAHFHHFVVPISVVVVFGTESHQHPSLMFVAYMSLLGFLHLIGTWIKQKHPQSIISGYQIAGKLVPLGLLMVFSFYDAWKELRFRNTPFTWIEGQEFHLFLLLTVLTIALGCWLHFREKVKVLNVFNVLALVYAVIFFISMANPFLSTILVNTLLLGLGIMMVIEGGRTYSLTTLNVGMLTLMALLICRFFDLDINFVTRGILFILLGIGFFLGNYWIVKKKKI